MPGPPPKPTALKLLAGNPGKRRINAEEPRPAIGARMPSWLPPAGQEKWKTLAPQLVELGVLTEVDAEAFARLCLLQAMFHGCVEDAQAREDGAPVFSVAALLDLSKELRALESRFGLTPADRSRIKASPKKPESKLSRFIGGK
jgi:P27 family predicted phage terminase small subunit